MQDIEVIPKSGMIVPEMGMTKRDVNLAGALFTPVQARVLGLLFGQPDRTFQSAEIIRLARSGTGAVHRQLARLEAAGLVTVERSGNQKFYRASQDSPVFAGTQRSRGQNDRDHGPDPAGAWHVATEDPGRIRVWLDREAD